MYAEIEQENERAQRDAEAAQQRAEDLLADAQEKMAEARRLADEAREAAGEAAEQASRTAEELSRDLESQAKDAARRVRRAEELRERSSRSVSLSRGAPRANGNLRESTRAELLELASEIGVEGRTRMKKSELVAAIKRSSRTTTVR